MPYHPTAGAMLGVHAPPNAAVGRRTAIVRVTGRHKRRGSKERAALPPVFRRHFPFPRNPGYAAIRLRRHRLPYRPFGFYWFWQGAAGYQDDRQPHQCRKECQGGNYPQGMARTSGLFGAVGNLDRGLPEFVASVAGAVGRMIPAPV